MKTGMPKWVVLLAFGLIAATVAGCEQSGGASVTLRETDVGRTIELKRGDTLIVELEGMPTTGFQWEVVSIDKAVLRQQGDPEYTDSQQGLIGGGGLFIFTFKTVVTGQTELEMVYHQPWEKDTPPAKTLEVTVIVE